MIPPLLVAKAQCALRACLFTPPRRPVKRPSALRRLAKAERDQPDHAYPLLATHYSDALGCLGRDLVSMLRSCLAMMLGDDTSFTVWVRMMRNDPFYALIGGFHPDDTPGMGTLYDFQDRLLQRPHRTRTRTRRPYQNRDQRGKA
ncbi:MAG: hypothetical protein P8189_07265 [Anaerolineae bacterium]|jgi:hypothetical protein